MSRLVYDRNQLVAGRKQTGYPSARTIVTLKRLCLYKARSRRGGSHIHRPIPSIALPYTNSPRPAPRPPKHRYLTPIPRQSRPIAHPPSILLTNPTSITNKFDELCLVVKQRNPDLIALTETWFSITKPAHLYELSDYDLFHKDRDTRGGGVCVCM